MIEIRAGIYFFGADISHREGTNGRALTTSPSVSGALTVALCIQACKNGGYAMAGVEYAGECCMFSQALSTR